MRNELRFGLLGPPVLYDADGEFRSIGGGKMRALLAALLLEPGRVVSVDVLKDALWGGAPPASAHASLQNHVTRLRRLLDDHERLRAVPPGYVLRVGEGELDVRVFEQHATAARTAHAERAWERALSESTSALALWRGTPLSGLPPEIGGHAFVQRLEEARLLVLEWRYEAELRLSDLGEAQARPRAARHTPAPSNSPRSARAGGPPSPDRPEAEGAPPSRAGLGSNGGDLGRGPSSGTPDAPIERRGNVPELPGGRSAPTPDRLDRLAPELAALTAEHPFREAFHRLLMLVLHRTGRQAEALAVHRDLRARLVEELGIEPGPAVREAHLEILRERDGTERAADVADDAGRAEREAAVVPSDPGPLRPAQLPPPPAYFTGRDDLRQKLRLALDPERRIGGPGVAAADGTPCVAVISGMAGVGKSALALHVAHGLRERFPDGQLYVNLHGATPGMTPLSSGQALAALLRDLGAEPRRIPEHRDAAAALLRSILAPTRTLMVLDDAAHAAQVRPLLPAGAGCAVIVTSRSPLTALDGAHRFPLAPLSDEDSAALLRAVSGRRNGLDGGHPLVELTGRLPLALRVVAARLAARHALTPDMLAGQLAATEGRLHHLEYDDLSVRRSLAVAHDALRASEREADRDAALALCRIGALDLPAYGAPLLARLLGIAERRAEAALDRLVDVALLEETAYGRYAPHDLVRDFAREIAGATSARPEFEDERGSAIRGTWGAELPRDGTGSGGGGENPSGARAVPSHAADSPAPAGPGTPAAGVGNPAPAGTATSAPAGTGGPVPGGAGSPARGGADRSALAGTGGPVPGGAGSPARGGADRSALAGTGGPVPGGTGSPARGGADRSALAGTGGPVPGGAGSPARGGADRSALAGTGGPVPGGTGSPARGGTASPAPVGTGASAPAGTGSPAPAGTGTTAPAGSDAVTPGGQGAALAAGHDAAVAERALRWYAGVAARSLEAILEPGLDREDRSRPTASQPPPHTADVAATPPFCSAKDAFAWGDLELENLVALVERHAESSPYIPVLVRLLNPYVQRSGRVAELEILQRAALGAARRLGDEAAEAYALGDLAGLHFMTGRASDALVLNDEALAIWRRLGVLSWVRRGLNNRGMLLEGLGRYAESSEALLQSLEFSRELGDPHMEAITYSHLGNLYEHSDPRAAIDHHKRSLAIGDTIQDVIIRHSAHCNIGYAHLTLGEPAAAVPHFEESLRILGSHGDWHGESQTRLGLVRALRGVGHGERAARECDLLLCRADRRADRYTGGLARHQRGLLLRSRGDAEGAYEQWESALEALAETDSPVVGELRTLLAEQSERA
ncbi:BTAD domain-containing putative transcriptional regulator [Streptomyces sp. NBC_00996]|uniref:BTAD domain-containing putative transcriptional regulator n=1 Tax=Streptomyces sp. NBC_00996 TaxID=2903710 RepID=UPI0038702568|nr:tetratricopeptide repeat protein [Streptomyces sp. NBC_00996]